jgi:integrase
MAALPKTIDVGRVHLVLYGKFYHARWTQNGERKSRTTKAQTPRGAIAFAERVMADLEHQGQHEVLPANITIQEAFEKFQAEYDGWRPSTWASSKYFFSARFLPSFAHRRILAITSRELALWLSEQRKRPTESKGESTDGSEQLSASAYNGFITYLNAFWKYCVLHGVTAVNPAKELKRKSEPRYMDVEARVLTEEQVTLLLDDLSTLRESPHAYLLTALAVDTGMRRGELWALTWDDIDWEKNQIRVDDSVDGMGTKTGNTRYLPMTKRVREALRNRRLKSATAEEGPVPRVNIKKALIAAGRRLGIGHIHFHMLRHTAATRFREAGMDLPVIQRALGHSNIMMTRRYMATRQNELVEGMKDVDELNRRQA